MSLYALNSAISGLRVAQQQLSVISNNISNATTPGYTRKILPQSTQAINTTGETIGVRGDPIIRKVDLNLERELWTKVSVVSYSEVKASYLDTIEKFHGATNKETSIAAQISLLKDKFAGLADAPADGFSQQAIVSQAETVARELNEFGQLLTEMRNDAQADMGDTVGRINTLLEQVANLNKQIKGQTVLGRSTAAIADQRDNAVKELATLMDVTFFTRGDGVMVVQTQRGVQLADETATPLYFNPQPLGATSTYPANVAGIYVGGNPATNPSAVNITDPSTGGKLGALIELRDQTLVQYQAQMDETAHKLALRLDAQGLRLFTDASGTVPVDTPPDPNANPPVAVSYVGFASTIRVNEQILKDITLVQKGTYTSDKVIQGSSNEVIRRVIEFGFGTVSHMEANGTTNLNVALPATDLQSWLGLPSSNNVVGGINLSNFTQIDDGAAAGTDLMETLRNYITDPLNDQFRIIVSEPRLGVAATTLTIDLSAAQANFPIGSPGVNNALDQIIAEINAQVTATPAIADLNVVATKNANGQLSIQSRGNVELSAHGQANDMGTEAFGALGFSERTYPVEDPYFDVRVGTNEYTRITIAPGDDINDLIAKLEYNPSTGTGVPGLRVAYDAGTGQLSLRPGMDENNGGPRYGGDMKIVSGPAMTNSPVNGALAALPGPVSIVAALFGSFAVSGGAVTESSPIRSIEYQSETFAGSGEYVSYRKDYLGAGASVKTQILTGSSVVDFAQKVINYHAQDIISNNAKAADETSLRDLLQERFTNDTGVNIDEELSTLIVIQTAYSAAARAITAADEMFDELLGAFR
ncbi:MAG: flagellar hook-associated protein FlgK [Micavibrio aeruginosavorus]|uniref:Flagellar hook-associated protein 1 n=1 Tax=Micavibrio aeruginosavorus TaxID=349221 RepID=A0A2W5A5E5_9BACT|nr:MAG: flagellar hook-associated protein FlgK [Micavibrio aeruginosavorus]